MQLEDFQDYFKLFIINYLPFKDQKIYQTISNYLLNYYFTHSYSDIPAGFKSAFEEQTIPLEFYDYILLSNGFTEEIILKLSLNDKYILLQTFMDFNRYKGTLESIRKVSASFQDIFNIYELYLDYRNDEWIFLPNLVYKNPKLENQLINTTFTYEEIVNKTKNFLISKETADALRISNNILLPIKTNLVLLDYKGLYQHSELLLLYSTILLNHFKDYPIILYLKDGQYKTSFKNFYRAWYYIFFKIFDITYAEISGTFINFNFQKEPFPLNLDQLFEIKSEYETIKTRSDITKFRRKYAEIFKTYTINDQQTSKDLISSYSLELPSDLISYLDLQIIDKITAELVLDDLYNSLITWMFSLQEKYDTYREFLQIFIGQLPLLNVSLFNSTSYLLINHLKPYHSEIVLNDNYSSLYIKDKFNSILTDHFYLFNLLLQKVSISQCSYYIFKHMEFKDNSSLPIIASLVNTIFKIIEQQKITITELKKFLTKTNNKNSISHINDIGSIKSKDYSFDSIPIISILGKKKLIKFKIHNNEINSKKYKYKFKKNKNSLFIISLNYTPSIIKNHMSNVIIMTNYSSFKNFGLIRKSNIQMNDKFKNNLNNRKQSLTIINDELHTITNKYFKTLPSNIKILYFIKGRLAKTNKLLINSNLNKIVLNNKKQSLSIINDELHTIANKYNILNNLSVSHLSEFISRINLDKTNPSNFSIKHSVSIN